MNEPLLQPPEPLSVSDLSYQLKSLVEGQFASVFVKGEISGLKRHTSGHVYFALKDDQSVLDAVCWRGTAARLEANPQDGMEVICRGKLTTYPGRSKYQMVVESMTLSGEGALLKLLEERRRRLAEEGLFDDTRKKPLPLLPGCIGIITSPTGAVIQDILHRLHDRCPRNVLLWPVTVQGDNAAPQIIKAIEGFNDPAFPFSRPDVLIVARGGGSLEDLWAFNDEALVRAVAASQIPVIAGVGHEPDVTLIDYVADWRAPTPTAAAERAVPVRGDLLRVLDGQKNRLTQALWRQTQETQQRLDDRSERLHGCMPRLLGRVSQEVTFLSQRLRHPRQLLDQHQLALSTLLSRREGAWSQCFYRKETILKGFGDLLKSYSYTATLERGFTLVQQVDGGYLKSARDVVPGLNVEIIFKDGARAAVIAGAKAPKRKEKKQEGSTQASLW
ncbi:MAG: exodeoxyribonuclease VII large subunit [Alphaproteobacteria bacterium]|nr:exodeoxyribonuclease VII large subunit [Alphaproteobacteria bacterium]